MAMTSTSDIIRASTLVVGLSDKQIRTLAQHAKLRQYEDRQLVAKEGAQSEYLFILKKGTLIVEKGSPDPFVLNTLREPSTFFGEISLIDAKPHSASIRSQGVSEVLVFHKKDLVSFFLHHPDAQMSMVLNMARELSSRLREADERLVQQAKSSS